MQQSCSPEKHWANAVEHNINGNDKRYFLAISTLSVFNAGVNTYLNITAHSSGFLPECQTECQAVWKVPQSSSEFCRKTFPEPIYSDTRVQYCSTLQSLVVDMQGRTHDPDPRVPRRAGVMNSTRFLPMTRRRSRKKPGIRLRLSVSLLSREDSDPLFFKTHQRFRQSITCLICCVSWWALIRKNDCKIISLVIIHTVWEYFEVLERS